MEMENKTEYFNWITKDILYIIFKTMLKKEIQITVRLLCKRFKKFMDEFHYDYTIFNLDKISRSPNIKIRNLDAKNEDIVEVSKACSRLKIEHVNLSYTKDVKCIKSIEKCYSVTEMNITNVPRNIALALSSAFPNLKCLQLYEFNHMRHSYVFDTEDIKRLESGEDIEFMGNCYKPMEERVDVAAVECVQRRLLEKLGENSKLESINLVCFDSISKPQYLTAPWLTGLKKLRLVSITDGSILLSKELWNIHEIYLRLSEFPEKIIIPEEARCKKLELDSETKDLDVACYSRIDFLIAKARNFRLVGGRDSVVKLASIEASEIDVSCEVKELVLGLPVISINGMKVSYARGYDSSFKRFECIHLRLNDYSQFSYILELIVCIPSKKILIATTNNLKLEKIVICLEDLISNLKLRIDSVVGDRDNWLENLSVFMFTESGLVNIKDILKKNLETKGRKRLSLAVENSHSSSLLEINKKRNTSNIK